MRLKTHYLLFDPGYSHLLLALRGSLTFLALVLSGHFLFKMSAVNLIFVVMPTLFALINLYSPTPKAHLMSALRASLFLYGAALLGLYYPFSESTQMPLFLCAVFISYYLTRFGREWFFHPVIASIILLVTMSLSSPATLEPFPKALAFVLFSFAISLIFQFVLLKSKNIFGVQGNLQSILNCLNQTYFKITDGERRKAKKVWKKANVKTNQLIQFGRQLNVSFEQKKNLELYVIELYSLVRLTLNLLDSIKELENSFFQFQPFREKVLHFVEGLKNEVEKLIQNYEHLSLRERKNLDESNSYLHDKRILNDLLALLPENLSREELSPLYLFCFSYRRSLELLKQLQQRTKV